MSFKLSNLAKVEKSIDVRENDKDVREIDIHLAEVLRLIDPFDFAPAVHFAQRIYITNAWTSAEERVYKLRNYVIGHFLRSIVSWSMAHSNDST